MNTQAYNIFDIPFSYTEKRKVFSNIEYKFETETETNIDTDFSNYNLEATEANNNSFAKRENLQAKVSQTSEPTEAELQNLEKWAKKGGTGAIKKLADLFNMDPTEYFEYGPYAEMLSKKPQHAPQSSNNTAQNPAQGFDSMTTQFATSTGVQIQAAKQYPNKFSQWMEQNPTVHIAPAAKAILANEAIVPVTQKVEKTRVLGIQLTKQQIAELIPQLKGLNNKKLGDYILTAQNREGDMLRLLEEEAIQRITKQSISIDARITQDEIDALSYSDIQYGQQNAAEYYGNLVEALKQIDSTEAVEKDWSAFAKGLTTKLATTDDTNFDLQSLKALLAQDNAAFDIDDNTNTLIVTKKIKGVYEVKAKYTIEDISTNFKETLKEYLRRPNAAFK